MMKWQNHLNNTLAVMTFVAACTIAHSDASAGFRFGKPQNLGSVVNSPSLDGAACISMDGLTLYFASDRPGSFGYEDIWVTTRSSVSEPWGPPVNLGPPVNSQFREIYPSISADGLELYFSDSWTGSQYRPGGIGSRDLWRTKRQSPGGPWATPVNLGAIVNSTADEWGPIVSYDDLTLVFASSRAGGIGDFDLWMCSRTSTQADWGPPTNAGPTLNSTSFDVSGSLSSDGLVLFFESTRPGGVGGYDVWMATRKTLNDPWNRPINLGSPIDSSATDGAPMISADGRMLYFTSNRGGGFGGYDLWQVAITPTIDFNGDEKVDIEDLVRLIESWGTDDPAVDIGPLPWGDGKVDAADLEVLMGHWGQEIPNPALIAHWRLDDPEGVVAIDSAGTSDGVLVGDPVWQPTGGQVGGALQLDGVDDCVTTQFVRNPSEGPFSVFAWIKGGAPGQVIVSQEKGANWLMASASDGTLATELKSSGRLAKPLKSAVSITDGAWHRVGLVWDGSNRILYVDDIEVASDAQAGLAGTYKGLRFGAGSTLALDSFWNGLIDDVRIYDRAVQP